MLGFRDSGTRPLESKVLILLLVLSMLILFFSVPRCLRGVDFWFGPRPNFSLTKFPVDRLYLGIDNLGLGNLWLRMRCFREPWACWSCACCNTARCTATPLPSAFTLSLTTCFR